MSLKDLLPPGAYEEITAEVNDKDKSAYPEKDGSLKVRCPTCGKIHTYDQNSPFRPFCSRRCSLIDLGAWANEEMVIKGRKVNEDEDAELLKDPALPKRNEINQDF